MTDWDAGSGRLRDNLHRLVWDIRRDARARAAPTAWAARQWHRKMMHGLTPPRPEYVGRFRGERGLERCEVRIAGKNGVPSDRVAEALRSFERTLQDAVAALDGLIAPGQELNRDQLAAIIDLCAWAHAEWVRIHPFANGNGRTARLWANFIAMRYGLSPFVRLRPRPDDGYGEAAAAAMDGHWQATVPVFRRMLRDAVREM